MGFEGQLAEGLLVAAGVVGALLAVWAAPRREGGFAWKAWSRK